MATSDGLRAEARRLLIEADAQDKAAEVPLRPFYEQVDRSVGRDGWRATTYQRRDGSKFHVAIPAMVIAGIGGPEGGWFWNEASEHEMALNVGASAAIRPTAFDEGWEAAMNQANPPAEGGRASDKHRWTKAELAELFYDALHRDHRSEDYTAEEMRRIASKAAWTQGEAT